MESCSTAIGLLTKELDLSLHKHEKTITIRAKMKNDFSLPVARKPATARQPLRVMIVPRSKQKELFHSLFWGSYVLNLVFGRHLRHPMSESSTATRGCC